MLSELSLMFDVFEAMSALLKSMRSTFCKISLVLVLILSVLVEMLAELVLMLDT